MKNLTKTTIILSSLVAVLIISLGYVLYLNQWHQKQYFLDNTQSSLVELQGIIAFQEDENWENPQLISNKLQIIIDDLWYGTTSYTFPSKVLNKEELTMLVTIANTLQQLPNNDVYAIAEWSKEDIEKAKIVNNALIKADLKMETTILVDWETFIKQCAIFKEELSKIHSL
ncbi:hypothetical protein JFL43_09935 [Viridibacillus sp. YIM B01967]|uniref:Uncharacterized protein n=1 Tax=Viridibacillus soli TaxID=2798301 RepID=A0ABS1H6X9_9BACL|nr:hypothetical protein [Viridibacillus soli]MBK3495169.1 hypothetical protein [Viridibacillus soli]